MTTTVDTKRHARQALTKKQQKLAEDLAATERDSDEELDLLDLIGETQPSGAQTWIVALADLLREDT